MVPTSLLKSVSAWSNVTDKLVMGIDGYSGSGKTTLANQLGALREDILVVHRDDFAVDRATFMHGFSALKREHDKMRYVRYRTLDTERLTNLLQSYKTTSHAVRVKIRNPKSGIYDADKLFDLSRPILVVEGIFLFDCQDIASLLDKKVYLDCDLSEADDRRRKREMALWGKDYFPDTRPDSISRLIGIAYREYTATGNPEALADVVIKA